MSEGDTRWLDRRVHAPTFGAFILLLAVLIGVGIDDFGTALGCSEGGESSIACYSTAPGYGTRHDLFAWSLAITAALVILSFVLFWIPRLMDRLGAAVPVLIAVLLSGVLITATVRYLQTDPSRAWCVRHGDGGDGAGNPCATAYN